jgi:hypothetical protein
VASIVTIGGIVTLASPDGTTLSGVQASDNPSPSDTPAQIDFPYGFLEFTISGVEVGGAASVTLHLPPGGSVKTYYKYGRVPDNLTPHWYEFDYDTTTGAEISGNTIILHFVDGQRGDDDLTANGSIVEPGAPSLSIATPGDLDGDEDIDLADAILALQVLAGIEPSSTIHKGADVNGNGKLGMEETIYILQTVSGMRAGHGPIGGLAGYKVTVTYHQDEKDVEKTWIEIELVDEEGNPVPGERYKITLPDGKTVSEGTLDANGRARVEGIDPGTCQISFPDLDKDAWEQI